MYGWRLKERGRENAGQRKRSSGGGGGKWEVRVLPHVYGIWMYM